ncbi:hypothetical protein ACGRHY_03535 [Streptomyces sp. HK10]
MSIHRSVEYRGGPQEGAARRIEGRASVLGDRGVDCSVSYTAGRPAPVL